MIGYQLIYKIIVKLKVLNLEHFLIINKMKLLICILFLIVLLNVSNAVDVNANWTHVVRTSRTPTLQIVLNGKYRRESKIHKQIFENLKNLQPKYCR